MRCVSRRRSGLEWRKRSAAGAGAALRARDLNWHLSGPPLLTAQAAVEHARGHRQCPRFAQEARTHKKKSTFPPHLVHVRAQGVRVRGPIFFIFNSPIGAPRPCCRSPGAIRWTQGPGHPPTQPKRRLASVFRAQEGAKWRLNRANPPPFEATRLAPGQRPCRRPKTRFRSPVHKPAAWLGAIRRIAPSASVLPRPPIWAQRPKIGRNRQNRASAGTVRSRLPGRVGRCPMALPRAPDLLSSFAWLTAA